MAEETVQTTSDVRIHDVTLAQRQQAEPRTEERDTQSGVFVRSRTGIVRRPFEPFLTIDGVIFPVKLGTATHQEEIIGTQRRTFNGRMRSGIRRRRNAFHVETPFLDLNDAMELKAVVDRQPPLEVEAFFFPGEETRMCHFSAVDGDYYRGGKVGARAGRELQLMSLSFDIIPE